MTLKIYIAGSSSERTEIQKMVDRVRAIGGCEVTYDWTRSRGWEDPTCEEAQSAHILDFEAVCEADVVWYVASHAKSEGAHCELGMAIALGKDIVASGPVASHGRIFPRFAITAPDHETVIAILKRTAETRTSPKQEGEP